MKAHDIIRNVTGYGPNHGPYLSIHDSFEGLDHWSTLLPGSDRIALDTHPYLIFYGDISEAPLSQQVGTPCGWADAMNSSWANYGVSTAGEWSLAINDCGKWINGVGNGARWDGTINGGPNTRGNGTNSCADWNNYKNWSDDRKANFIDFALHSMDALQVLNILSIESGDQ
jgi:glucan 1,3-beta-glucosidase